MSLEANRRRINHLAGTTLVEVPALARSRGAVITAEIINRVREIIKRNKFLGSIKRNKFLGSIKRNKLPLGSTSGFLVAGLFILSPSLLVTAVNVLGFTAGGVLKCSIAALIHTAMLGGRIAGGGLFAVLQAFGATATISPPVVIIGVGVVSVAVWRMHCERRRISQNSRKSDEDEDGIVPNSHRKDSI